MGLVVLLSGVFLAVMNTFIVNVAIPSIQREFGASPSEISAVVAFYGLAYGCMLITGGRLGDLYGRRRMFVWGLSGFTATALVCGLATSAAMLIAARIGEGLAAAMMFPQILSIIRVTAGDEGRRARAFAAFGVALGLSGISGPLIGGALIAADLFGTGWRLVFLVSVPIGFAACAGAIRWLPETRPDRAARLDVTGALLCACGLGLLLYALIEGRHAGWPGWIVGFMIAGGGMLVVFLLDQRGKARRCTNSLIQTDLFAIPAFSSGTAIAFLFHSTLVGFLFALALFLQVGLHYSPWQTAWVTVPIPAAFLVTSLIANRQPQIYGSLAAMLTGGFLTALGYGGCIVIAMTHHVANGWGLVPVLLAVGVGQGLFLPPLLNAVLASTRKDHAGSAAGLVATCQQVGGAFGVAIVNMFYFGVSVPVDSPDTADHAYAFMLGMSYQVGVILLVLGLLPILFGRKFLGRTVVRRA